jgi:hypothetical protein
VVVLWLAWLGLLLRTGCKVGLWLTCGCGTTKIGRCICQLDPEGARGQGDTVVVAQEETKESIKTEPVEDVPGERGDPSDVHVGRVDTTLEHLLKAEGEGKGQFD